MQLRSRWWSTRVVLLLVALSVLPAPFMRAQDPGEALDDALCQLWSPDEVARAVGGDVQPIPDFGSCYWLPVDAAAPWMQMSVSWTDSTLDRQRAIGLDGREVALGTVTGWWEEVTGNLYLPFSDGLLSIVVSAAAPGVDLEAAAVSLAELALSRPATLPAPPSPFPTVGPLSSQAPAPSGIPSALP